MSLGTRIPWAEAYEMARSVSEGLAPVVARSKCVGSVRRRRPEVGDIEFVVEPHFQEDLVGGRTPIVEPIRAVLEEIGTWVKGGEKMMQVTDLYGRSGATLDIYLVTPPAQWGSIVAIRTGPPDLSRYVVTECRRRGIRHKDGHAELIKNGEIVPTVTEEQFFALADEAPTRVAMNEWTGADISEMVTEALALLPTEGEPVGDMMGQARSWHRVYELCRDLGMHETQFPRTGARVTGCGKVLDFIRYLATPQESAEIAEPTSAEARERETITRIVQVARVESVEACLSGDSSSVQPTELYADRILALRSTTQEPVGYVVLRGVENGGSMLLDSTLWHRVQDASEYRQQFSFPTETHPVGPPIDDTPEDG